MSLLQPFSSVLEGAGRILFVGAGGGYDVFGAVPLAVDLMASGKDVHFAGVTAVKPLAVDRYEIRFTASAATRDKLKVAQDLLRHAIPSGDVAAIFDRALSALIEAHSRRKMAIVRRPAKARAVNAGARPVVEGSRHVAAQVKRAVWIRDGGRCAFVGESGHRCRERALLEYHHAFPFAVGGQATTANIQLRCRAHNGYEADLFFGADGRKPGADGVAERSENYAVSWSFTPVPERPQRRHCAPRSARRSDEPPGDESFSY